MKTRRCKVLLIEDDEDDYVLVRDMLSESTSSRFHLDWAQTYEAGLSAVCSAEHDMVLLDYRLGNRNGLELLQEAIAKGCKPPIVLLTGQGDYEIDLKAMGTGAADYLVKEQITPELLDRSIRYSIERKRTELELIRYRDHLEELVTERTFQLSQRTKELEEANASLHHEMAARKKVEEKLLKAKKLEAAGILAGGIAHDFNNILAAVLGHINLAQRTMDPGAREFAALENAEKAIFQASQLTTRFITFSTGGVPARYHRAV